MTRPRATDPRERRAAAARAKANELERHGVAAVACTMLDNSGVVRLMSVPLRRFEEAARFGVGMSTVFSVMLVDDDIVGSPGIEGPSGDNRLMPDPDATAHIPGMPGWAFAPVDIVTQEREASPACPRTFLKRMVEELGRRGIEMRCGFEIEFFLGRRGELPPGLADEPEPVPSHRGPGYGPQALTKYSAFSADVVRGLEELGIGVHKYHPEYAIGQFEVSFPPRDPVAAADAVLLVRQLLRANAATHGLDVSFAPVVLGAVGNGQHVHFSLWDRRGRDLFAGGKGPHGMTEVASSFSAGVLEHLPSLVAITAPSVPSYYRLQPHLWSGAHRAWGRENREAALRFVTGMVGERDRTANMEVKPVDGASNAYLVIGSLIAAGLDGAARNVDLPPETTEDPLSLSSQERDRRGIRRLPTSLGESIKELEGSDVLRRAMGDVLFDAFLATRRGEADRFGDREPEDVVRAHRWRY